MSALLSRRNFLRQFTPTASGPAVAPARTLSSGLDPFVPDANHPWDEIHAGHLLRRTMMGPTWADIQTLVKLGDPGKAVDLLLNTTSTPTAPAAANDATENPYPLALPVQYQIEGQWAGDAAQLRAWWANLHLNASTSIQEKMTLFWSGHFTTQFDLGATQYVIAPLLYRQNALFRSNALGNFQDLVKGVTLDGAMLVYLGGNQNTVGKPNENYGRELMELYTCGLGGGYTEADVQAAARILTGWRVGQYTDDPAPNGIFATYFDPASHDTQSKTYLTVDFPSIDASTNTEFLVRKNEIDRLIDVLFEKTGTAIANFISRKLYRFFVYSDAGSIDESVVSAMANLFIQSNWEIKPVVSALLKSAHFFDNTNIGCQIKTPAEYVIGMARQLAPNPQIDAKMTAVDQEFFQPPNVSGWPGYHDWITTNTYPVRGTEAEAAIQSMTDTSTIAFVQQFPNYTDASSLVIAIGQLLLPRPLSTERQSTFASKLTAGAPIYEWPTIWNSSQSTAARNVRDLLSYIVSLPDFELC